MTEPAVSDFERSCVARVSAGDGLSEGELEAFRQLLAERERGGQRLLGRFAGPDPSFDTVTGRCGIGPNVTVNAR